jgi:hypothetical protein
MSTKIKTSETITVLRSQINFAAYNPRLENEDVVRSIRQNFRKVGFLGGIVWNALTGNLVSGHKRVQALDVLNNYDGTLETDYPVKVERVEMDEKTEKEQNIYMNNQTVQGEFDFEKLAALLPDIDPKSAGLSSDDLDLIATYVPDVDFGTNDTIVSDIENVGAELQEQQQIERTIKQAEKQENQEQEQPEQPEKAPFDYRQVKQQQKEAAQADAKEKYVTLSFTTYDAKYLFLTKFGFNPDATIIKGEDFDKKLE